MKQKSLNDKKVWRPIHIWLSIKEAEILMDIILPDDNGITASGVGALRRIYLRLSEQIDYEKEEGAK